MADAGAFTLVVVDDSRTTLATHVQMCEEIAGVKVIGKAHNGADAVREVKQKKPDLVLLDLVMPDIDGYVALRMLCKGIPGTRVAVVSSLAGSERGDEAYRQGAVAVLSKPLTQEALTQLVSRERSRETVEARPWA